ncbi:hypothetical protein AAVH_17397 [Aphelenchoides avenae]|nr:hypothetical protein AAVH_17397 [Aphelenchus avenae]
MFDDDAALAQKDVVIDFDNPSGTVIIFKNVLAKQPSDQRFLPGSIPFELRFGNASTMHVMPQTEAPITTLPDVVHTLGRRNADFNVPCTTNFKDFTASFGGIPTYRGNVTDGHYKTLLQIPFQPHFKAGQELTIKKFMPHVNGNDVFISISSVADAVVVDADKQKVERKIKLSSLIPLELIKKENVGTTDTEQKIKEENAGTTDTVQKIKKENVAASLCYQIAASCRRSSSLLLVNPAPHEKISAKPFEQG